MPRVNLLKRIKTDGVWVLRSIPRKPSGGYDWGALPDGRYFVEWYEAGKRTADPDKVAEQFRGYGGTVLRTTLTKEQSDKVQTILDGRRLTKAA